MNTINNLKAGWNTILALFSFFTGGVGVTLSRDLQNPSFIHSREIFRIAKPAPLTATEALKPAQFSVTKKRKGGRADGRRAQPGNDNALTQAAPCGRNDPASTWKPKPKTNTHTMRQTIILICKGEAPPMRAIIELLGHSGNEIEHASFRVGGKTHIEIGTPQDLEEVPLPKEVQNLKLTPEQEAMFRKLIEIDQQGAAILTSLRSFVSYEKRSDKAKEPDGEGGKKRGKKNEGGAAPTANPKLEDEQKSILDPEIVTAPAAGDEAADEQAKQEADTDADSKKEAPDQEQTQTPEGNEDTGNKTDA